MRYKTPKKARITITNDNYRITKGLIVTVIGEDRSDNTLLIAHKNFNGCSGFLMDMVGLPDGHEFSHKCRWVCKNMVKIIKTIKTRKVKHAKNKNSKK